MSTHSIFFHGEIRKKIIWILFFSGGINCADVQVDLGLHCSETKMSKRVLFLCYLSHIFSKYM